MSIDSSQNESADPSRLIVPLFPLPDVVLFPRAVLPLHVFEPRYKTMTADALSGQRRIAMALLQPGWEPNYHQSNFDFRPAIDPIICIGRIATAEPLPDGQYNFLLVGESRARIIEEIDSDHPYRTARVELLQESPCLEIDLSSQRERIARLFASNVWANSSEALQINRMIDSPLSTADIADLIAFNLLNEVSLKQSLLAETDVMRRVNSTIAALEKISQQRAPRADDGRTSLN